MLDGDAARPPHKGGTAPSSIFGPLWPNGWMIKTARGTEVGLGPGHIVLDGGPAPQPRKGVCMKMPPAHLPISPQFSAQVYCGQTVAWIKMPLGMDVGLSPGDFVLDGGPAPSRKRRRSSLPNFRAISIVAKGLDASRCHLVWR